MSIDLSKATTLVNIKDVKGLEDKRAASGYFIPCPTNAEVVRRHEDMKGKYAARDKLIRDFQMMVQLELPYRQTKATMQAEGIVRPDGEVSQNVASFPFDVITYAQSRLAQRHPYVEAIARPGQSDTQVEKFEQFTQGILDERLDTSDIQFEALQYLMVTGWLIGYWRYSKEASDRGEFPYEWQYLNPIGVYPAFDHMRRVMWVSVERYMTGADLIQNYGRMPGVLEMFMAEDEAPTDSPAYRERNQPGNSFLTTEFRTIMYYDDTYTALLVDASRVSGIAARHNNILAQMKAQSSKGKYVNVMWGSKARASDPYAGVEKHGLGCLPFVVDWCWPEIRERMPLMNSQYDGRYLGYPWLYSSFKNWQYLSRIYSQLQTAILRNVNPKLLTTSQTAKFDSDVVRLENTEDARYLTPPTFPQEALAYMQEIKQQIDRATIGAAAYNEGGATSGIQEQQMGQSADIRLDPCVRKIERSYAKVLKGIAISMKHRDDEPIEVVSQGKKYGKSYAINYDIRSLKEVPAIKVFLRLKRGFIDTERVQIFKTLQDTVSTETLLEEVLEVPNPRKEMEKRKQELIEMETSNLQIDVQEYNLKRQIATAQEMAKLQWQLEQIQKEVSLWREKKEIEEEAKIFPAKLALDQMQQKQQQMEQMAQQALQQMSPMMPGQPGLGGASGTSTPMSPSTSPGMSQPPPALPSMGGPAAPTVGITSTTPPGPPPMANGVRPMGATPPPPWVTNPMPPQGGPGPMQPPTPGPSMPPGMSNAPQDVRVAKAPGQAEQPIQPLSRSMPPGGIGRPGLDNILAGPQRGQQNPAIEASNRKVAPLPKIGEKKNRRRRR